MRTRPLPWRQTLRRKTRELRPKTRWGGHQHWWRQQCSCILGALPDTVSLCCNVISCILNSLAPGRFKFNLRLVIFKLTWVNGGWGISYEIALRWMPLDLTDDKSTSVQVMAWCRQATSHYLSQCWPRSMSPNGITRPQWVNRVSCFFNTVQYNMVLMA